ncbi:MULTISPECIES: alpha/beta fold hydrolase [unclassified Marinovum]
MALLRINAEDGRPVLHPGVTETDLDASLAAALALPGPVTIMVHGFRYAPGHKRHCPHKRLFAMRPTLSSRVISWPHHLGFGHDAPPPGVGVAFGWNARGSLRAAYDEGARAGRALGDVIRKLRQLDPARPVHVLAHSLGARVALAALAHLEPGDISCLILMAGAEYRSCAVAALATPAGRETEVVHVTSGENDLYDSLLEWLAPCPGDRALGAHSAPANLRSLLLDDSDTLAALARLGHTVAPPQFRICHWSTYMRPGIFGFYRALLSGALSPARLDLALPCREPGRWSRLVPGRISIPGFALAGKGPAKAAG